MAFTDTDRRRFLMATTLTLLALPALWWANTSDKSTAPSVAVAGLDIGESDGAADGQDPAAAQEAAELDATSDPAPVFLNGPSSATGAAIACTGRENSSCSQCTCKPCSASSIARAGRTKNATSCPVSIRRAP